LTARIARINVESSLEPFQRNYLTGMVLMPVPLPRRWDVLARKLSQELDHDRLSMLVAELRVALGIIEPPISYRPPFAQRIKQPALVSMPIVRKNVEIVETLAMIESRFLILKHVGKTPSLATCQACHLKFFVPMPLVNDPRGAEDYLRQRHAEHKCKPVVFSQTSPVASKRDDHRK
jgi:hypothetical protein